MTKFIDITKRKKKKYIITRPGQYLFFIFNQSGSIEVEINGPRCRVHIFGIFIGKKNESFEFKTLQHHNSRSSLSNLLIKGVFFGRSRFKHQGLIRIEKKAQKSDAFQKCHSLIMSKKCQVVSRPFLEVLANDVSCTHGSSIGQLSEDQIYYLASRGLTMKKTRKILMQGFINDIFSTMVALGYHRQAVDYQKQFLKIFNKIK